MNQVIRQHWINILLAICLSLIGVTLLGTVFMVGSKKQAAVILGGMGFALACLVSGNTRLLCLYMLMFTFPLNLAKNFSPILFRGGGETSLRIEVNEVFLAALAGYMLIDIWKYRRDERRLISIPKVSYVWMLVVLMGVNAMRWSHVAHLEVFRMCKVIVFFIILTNELKTKQRILHALTGLSAGVFFYGLIGAVQFALKRNLGLEILGETTTETIKHLSATSIHNQATWRVSSLLLHPNILGIFMGASLPLVFAMFLLPMRSRLKPAYLLALLFGGVALIASLSRSGWVSGFIAMVIFMVISSLHRKLMKRMLTYGVLSCLAGAMFLGVFSGKIMSRIFESKDVAMYGRAEFKKEAKRMIADRPMLGHGLNTYADVVPTYTKYSSKTHGNWFPPVHHIYYLWWAEVGLLGLAFHLIVLAMVIWNGVLNIRVRDPILYMINAACLGAICAFLFDGFFSFSLRINSIIRLFWIIGALIMAIRYWRIRHEVMGLPVPGGRHESDVAQVVRTDASMS